MGRPRASYFRRLRDRVEHGLREFPASDADRHARFGLSFQQADGGFAGREGGSDLYYTAFAIRALSVLGRLDRPVAEQADRFLRAAEPTTIVDLLSWLSAAEEIEGVARREPALLKRWTPADLLATLADFRSPDGGYALTPDRPSGSVYQTFLAALCCDVLGETIPDAEGVLAFVEGRRRADGGFAEHERSQRGSTNASVAATALAVMLGVPGNFVNGVASFFAEMQTPHGGWSATRRAPVPDLLSTFTALATLTDLGGIEQVDLDGAIRFVQACERPEGGFGGLPMDDAADVEYTYYGLGCIALLAE